MLSSEKQGLIIEWMRGGGTGLVRTQVLSEFGFRPSETALGNFWRWWHMQQQFKRATEDASQLMELLKQDQPELSEEKIFSYGQRVFQLKAIQAEDPKTWVNVQHLAQARETTKLEIDKFKEATRTKIQAGLDALAESIKGNAAATEAFHRLQQTIYEATA